MNFVLAVWNVGKFIVPINTIKSTKILPTKMMNALNVKDFKSFCSEENA